MRVKCTSRHSSSSCEVAFGGVRPSIHHDRPLQCGSCLLVIGQLSLSFPLSSLCRHCHCSVIGITRQCHFHVLLNTVIIVTIAIVHVTNLIVDIAGIVFEFEI